MGRGDAMARLMTERGGEVNSGAGISHRARRRPNGVGVSRALTFSAYEGIMSGFPDVGQISICRCFDASVDFIKPPLPGGFFFVFAHPRVRRRSTLLVWHDVRLLTLTLGQRREAARSALVLRLWSRTH
ncbi:hypothetical protein MBUL_01670 [Methylobacterium bullatum]|uniref:Uncharacterized protein n=1 Tax=Methylobacterium bullatum TaxID=570505 RepID=A0A679J8C0_9HYPH|nr:hypothetical protein MBUL_01670 [Methylobacterium bullatum]